MHPASPLLTTGRYVLAGLAFSSQAWFDQVVAGGSFGVALLARVAVLLLLAALLALGWSLLAWRHRSYRVTDESVELRTGVLLRSHRQLPLERVESVDTMQPLIPRLLGLAEVRIEAIGARDSNLRLQYLELGEGERVRRELDARRKGRALGSGGATAPPAGGAPLPVDEEVPIYAVPVGELVLAYLAIPLGVVVVLAAPALLVAGLVAGWQGALGWLGVASISGLFASVSVMLRIEKLWGFRIDDAGGALVLRRGLLNLATQRIVAGRVQAIRVEQPLLWRPFGRHRLSVDVAGYRGAEREAAAAAAILVPVASAEVVRGLIERVELHVDPDALDYAPVPLRARWRSLRWRCFGVAQTASHTVVRTGVLWRRTTIVPRGRVQSARVTQGPWQRWLQLATLHLDTAGARLRIAARHRAAEEAVALAQRAVPDYV